MATDKVTIDADASRFTAAMQKVNASLSNTGKSIDGVKNTLEKAFAAQAIFSSASRVAEAINEVTDNLNAQTKAMQEVIAVSRNVSSTYDQLADASQKAAEQADAMRKSNEGWGAVKNFLLGIHDLQKEQAESAQALAEILQKQAEAAKQTSENMAKFNGNMFSGQREAAKLEATIKQIAGWSSKISGVGGGPSSLFGSTGAVAPDMRDNPMLSRALNRFNTVSTQTEVDASPTGMAAAWRRSQRALAQGASIGGMNFGATGGGIEAAAQAQAARAEVFSRGVSRLASQSRGRGIGSREDAARAQALEAEAQAAEEIGDTERASRLRSRAGARRTSAERSIARREARAARAEAQSIGRERALTSSERESQRTRQQAANERAQKLESEGRSTRPTGQREEQKPAKLLGDIKEILNTRLPK